MGNGGPLFQVLQCPGGAMTVHLSLNQISGLFPFEPQSLSRGIGHLLLSVKGLKNWRLGLGMVIHTFTPSSWEAERGRSQVQAQPMLE